jgi:hypothetical protein
MEGRVGAARCHGGWVPEPMRDAGMGTIAPPWAHRYAANCSRANSAYSPPSRNSLS